MIDDQAVTLTVHETKRKFYDAARFMYPNVGEPGTVWVLQQVLGWDWDKLRTVSIDGFSRDGYCLFLMNDENKPIWEEDGSGIKKVTRKWTKQEKSKLKDWWWLLGY